MAQASEGQGEKGAIDRGVVGILPCILTAHFSASAPPRGIVRDADEWGSGEARVEQLDKSMGNIMT